MRDRCFLNIRINYYFLKTLPRKKYIFSFRPGKLYYYVEKNIKELIKWSIRHGLL